MTEPEDMGPAGQSQGRLRHSDLVDAFTRVGVPYGGILMVHSSLSSIGHVEGGAETVVDALLKALGPDGTLVMPAFTYQLANDLEFVFDPMRTPSLMGAISEAARRWPNAYRSIHPRHSVSAIGPLAVSIASAGNSSAWDSESPMAQVIQRNGMFMMLGVPYVNLTALHVCEVELGVRYRTTMMAERRMRLADGTVVPLVRQVHRLFDGGPEADFNRMGQSLEDAGMVKIGHVGNAVARLFYGRDLQRMARTRYDQDENAFNTQNGAATRLAYGHTLVTPRGEFSIVDPAQAYDTSG